MPCTDCEQSVTTSSTCPGCMVSKVSSVAIALYGQCSPRRSSERSGLGWLKCSTPLGLETTGIQVNQQHGQGQAGEAEQQAGARPHAFQQIDLRVGQRQRATQLVPV